MFVTQSFLTLQLHWLKPTRLLCPWVFQASVLEWVATFFSRGFLPDPGIETAPSALAGNCLPLCYCSLHAKELDMNVSVHQKKWICTKFVVLYQRIYESGILLNGTLIYGARNWIQVLMFWSTISFFGHAPHHVASLFQDHGSNPSPLHWNLSLNHWMTREVPFDDLLLKVYAL